MLPSGFGCFHLRHPPGAISASQRLLLTTVWGSVVHRASANSPYYEQDDKADRGAVYVPGIMETTDRELKKNASSFLGQMEHNGIK